MRKLAIISLVLSIIALLVSVWVMTDGFGLAGTFAGVPTVGTTGGGKGGGTGQQNLTTTTQPIVSGDVSGASLRVTIVKDKDGVVGTITAVPTYRNENNQTTLVGFTITNVDSAAAQMLLALAKDALSQTSDLRNNIILRTDLQNPSDLIAFRLAVEQQLSKFIDVDALGTQIKTMLSTTTSQAATVISGVPAGVTNWSVPVNSASVKGLTGQDGAITAFTAQIVLETMLARERPLILN